MRSGLLACLAAFVVAGSSRQVYAADWYVTAGGTGAQTGADWDNALPTITAAMALSQSGDAIWVWVGAYHERITLKSGVKLSGGHFFYNVWLPFWSTLDGDDGGSVVTIQPGAGPSTVLEGFTIQNGSGTRVELPRRATLGGGIYCANAQPTLRYNLFTKCRATYGGGVYLYNAAADVSLSHFTDNQARSGAGIYCVNGSPPIYICTFRRNAADLTGGAVEAQNASMLMVACNVFEANTAGTAGSAVHVDSGTVLSNSFVRNAGPANGTLTVEAGSAVKVVNNIVAGNAGGVWIAPGASVSIHHNDVYDNALGNYSGIPDPTGAHGNISADPALADPLVGDYTPCPGSPCIDRGDDSLVQTGWNDYYVKPRISGVCADIGAAEWQQTRPTTGAIHVKPGGNDTTIGIDWDTAMGTLQAAINAGIKYGLEVWVAAGTYSGPLKITNANVMLFGGFAGNETERNQRDPAKNVTILDGGLMSDSVVTISGEPNSAHMVDNRTVLDGFTIRNGFGYPWDASTQIGGGVQVNVAAPIICGNVIEQCRAVAPNGYGGGIYLEEVSPSVIPDTPIISCNTVRNNTARIGGGLYITYSNAYVRNNRFEGNSGVDSNGWPGFGGALGTEHANATMTGNTFVSNDATNSGGGIYSYVGSVVMRGNRIHDNSSGQYAAGIACSADAQIVNNTITGNHSNYGVGAMSVQSAKVTIANNLIAGNSALNYAGGLWGHEADITLSGNTFAGNNKETIELIATAATHTFSIANNIITGSQTGILVNAPAPSTTTLATNCLFANGTDYSLITPGATDIHADPRYVNPAGGDYGLLPGSPAIDAGTDTSAVPDWDAGGMPRIQGSHVDIGAYEYAAGIETGIAGVLSALRVAGGLQAATPSSMAALDVEGSGTSAGRIQLEDAVRLARILAGLG